MNQTPIPICDFCCSPEVKWSEWAEQFTIRVVGPKGILDFDADPQWATCDPCEQLILAGDQEALLRRSFTGHQLCRDQIIPDRDVELSMNLIRTMQSKFFALRRPAPTPWP